MRPWRRMLVWPREKDTTGSMKQFTWGRRWSSLRRQQRTSSWFLSTPFTDASRGIQGEEVLDGGGGRAHASRFVGTKATTESEKSTSRDAFTATGTLVWTMFDVFVVWLGLWLISWKSHSKSPTKQAYSESQPKTCVRGKAREEVLFWLSLPVIPSLPLQLGQFYPLCHSCPVLTSTVSRERLGAATFFLVDGELPYRCRPPPHRNPFPSPAPPLSPSIGASSAAASISLHGSSTARDCSWLPVSPCIADGFLRLWIPQAAPAKSCSLRVDGQIFSRLDAAICSSLDVAICFF